MKLAGCALGPAGAQYLADMLRLNRSLTSLGLAYNDIRAEGAAALGEVLPLNGTLTELDLRGNRLGAGGGLALAEGLLRNPGNKLTVLKVADNKVGDAAMARLAACFRGTARDGLKSVGGGSLDGPRCISGTLHGRTRRRRLDFPDPPPADPPPAEAPPPPADVRPPAMPKVRLLHALR